MEIRWLGQSAFLVRASTGTIVIDPSSLAVASEIRDPNTLLAFSRPEDTPREAPTGTRTLGGPGEFETGGLLVRGIGTPGEDPNVSRQINTLYCIDADGINVVSLGSLGGSPDTHASQLTGDVDVLIVEPEHQKVSIDELATIVRNLEPKVVALGGYDKAASEPGKALKALMSELGVKDVEPTNRITMTSRQGLPESRVAVVLTESTPT